MERKARAFFEVVGLTLVFSLALVPAAALFFAGRSVLQLGTRWARAIGKCPC